MDRELPFNRKRTRQDYIEEIIQLPPEETRKQLADLKYAIEEAIIFTITDNKGKILYVNDKFCEVTKYNREELIGHNHRILNSNYHPKEFYKNLWETVNAGEIWQGIIRDKAKDGSYIWLNTTIVPFLDDKGVPYQFISLRADVTEKMETEKELIENESKYRLITDNTQDIITVINREGDITFITPSCRSVLGYQPELLVNSKLLQWIHSKDVDNVTFMVKSIFKGRKFSGDVEFQIKKRDGTYLDAEAKISAIEEGDSAEIKRLVLVIRDITVRKHSENMIYHLTHHDTLTGLPNRAFFMNQLSREFYHAKVVHKEMAIFYMDVDRFKNINDALGHENGDTVLAEIANRIRKTVSSKDFIARTGGDEFAVILTDTSKEEVTMLAERIISDIQKPIKIKKDYHTISGSIGIALYPSDVTTPEELLKRANIASDNVKLNGRNNYLFFNIGMEERSLERILLENELKKAIEKNEFTLDYQPKIDITSDTLVGMEALVRWNHPELGKIPPGKFIPIAEETGLITVIGEIILQKACEQNKKWQTNGYPPLIVSVNLSTKQLYQDDLIQQIERILVQTGLEPRWLELEVTESAFTNLDNAQVILQQIRDLGIQVSIDDFGTGYSSFSYLKHLPINTLKIDASFVRDIDLNKESQTIVDGIVDIAKKLKLNVIAEGIETDNQLSQLQSINCPQGQGYFFSKPLSPNDFEEYLRRV